MRKRKGLLVPGSWNKENINEKCHLYCNIFTKISNAKVPQELLAYASDCFRNNGIEWA